MQSQIDDIAYPPTHTYNLSPLYPTGVLAKRVAIIEQIAPELFEGEDFLDVGANKGYFSMRAAEECWHVEAIEPDPQCQELLHDILPTNATLFRGTFGEYATSQKFDRVFIGNGHHYPFIEAGGWSWVHKLAKMATNLVVVEGPSGMACTDMYNCIPGELRGEFNQDAMLEAFTAHFDFKVRVPTVGYTPDRYIYRFEKT